MRKRKIYQLLAILDEEALGQFSEFLATPFFNTSQTLIRFFEAWQEHVLGPQYNPEMSVEAFLEGTGIQPARIDKLSTQLSRKVTEFLALVEYKNDAHGQQQYFLKALADRKMGISDLQWQYGRIAKRLQKEPDSSAKLYGQLELRRTLAEALVTSRSTRSIWQENFTDLHHLLDDYYQLEKLKLSCASLNALQIYNHGQEHPLPVPAIDSLPDSETLAPLPRCYALIIQIMHTDAHEHVFDDLLTLLDAHTSDFEPREAFQLYAYALNYCVRQMNQGKQSYRERTARLYRQLVANGMIRIEGQMPPQHFKNIISLHCRLGQLEWVRSFMDEEGANLPPEAAANAVRYNEAIYAFYDENYPEAIRRLKAVIADLRDDVFYGIDARTYLWRAYFEHIDQLTMAENDEMMRLYDAFRLFVERNDKISQAHKMDYRNFIRVFKRMTDLFPTKSGDPETMRSLKDEILQTSPLPNRGWLLERVEAALSRI